MRCWIYVFVGLVISQFTMAQTSDKQGMHLISTNLTWWLQNNANVGYEYILPKEKLALAFNGGYTMGKNLYEDYYGFRGEFQVRYYGFSEDAIDYYFGPYAQAGNLMTIESFSYEAYSPPVEEDRTDFKIKNTMKWTNVGLIIGLKAPIGKRFLFDGFLGAGIRSASISSEYNPVGYDTQFLSRNFFQPGYSGLTPRFGVSAAYKF